jgi:hypothetical protein
MKRWAKDTDRFLKKHWNKLRSDPMAVYHLSIFAPKSTIFQKVYAKSPSFPHPVVTMGLEEDWPTQMSISPHKIYSQCLSSCGNWFLTGGDDDSRAIFGVWNVELADGDTHVHPCHTSNCRVTHIPTCDNLSKTQLKTFCDCSLLCIWSGAPSPHPLSNYIKLDPERVYQEWNDDCSMAVTVMRQGDQNAYSLWRQGYQPNYIRLPEVGEYHWIFSPGVGDKLACRGRNQLHIWDCISGGKIVSKCFQTDVSEVIFAPDSRTILACIDQESIDYISLQHGETLWSIPCSSVRSFSFFPNGGKIAIVKQDEIIIINTYDGSFFVDPFAIRGVNSLFIDPRDE